MRYLAVILLVCFVFLASACQRHTKVCPEGSITYFASPASLPLASSPVEPELIETPALVEIKGKMREVDRVIQGPICQDSWQGIIYVACEIQIAEWQEAPEFFKECPLTIEPETIIYVAAHNDTAYYKGCSCHTGELTSR